MSVEPQKVPSFINDEGTGIDKIDSINFTSREIDIIACLLSGKSAKSIGAFLSIAPKTVESYVRNIMMKLGCNSRENIISFVEKSPQFYKIKAHYSSLMIRGDFLQKLHQIAKLAAPGPTCSLSSILSDKNTWCSKEDLSTYLSLAGIKIISQDISSNVGDYKICIAPNGLFNQNSSLSSNSTEILTSLIQQSHEKPGSIIVLLSHDAAYEPRPEWASLLWMRDEGNLYTLTFALLKLLLPSVNVRSFMEEFCENCARLQNLIPIDQKPKADILLPIQSKRGVFHHKGKLLALCTLLIGSILLAIQFSKMDFLKNPAIRSDFPLPRELQLLSRPRIMGQISNSFKNQQGIGVVTLMGIGGSGKTTLARQYARKQRLPVVWEFNAETPETLMSACEHLAYRLSKSLEEKKELDHIKKIEALEERKKKLLSFVQQRLKAEKQWYLVFDNVDNFAHIQPFFPHDVQAWGQGKVLITTRNKYIKDNPYIDPQHVIDLDPLTNEEKMSLFTKIMGKEGTLEVDTKEFLKRIPPFPLDISVAAHYIKHSRIGYKEYVQRIQEWTPAFDRLQMSFLKETSDYIKTRYGIITSTLKQLIHTSNDFGGLLFLLSLIEPDNIPKDLLDCFHDKDLADQFVHHMTKHSLITNRLEDTVPFIPLSIHRSTQEVIFQYLNHTLNTAQKRCLLENITKAIEQYSNLRMEKTEKSTLRLFLPHLLKFLSTAPALSEINKAIIEIQVGRIYCYLGDYLKAKIYLEQGLTYLRPYTNPQNTFRIARALAYLGSVVRKLGEYEKGRFLLEESQKVLPPTSPELAWTLLQLGCVYTQLGKYKTAQKVLQQSIAIYTACYGSNHPRVAWGYSFLGDVSRALGDYTKEKEYYQKSLDIYSKNYGTTISKKVGSMMRLAGAYKDLGVYGKTKELLEKSLVIFQSQFPEEHDNLASCLINLGNLYRILGHYEKAHKVLCKGINMSIQYYGKMHLQTSWKIVHLGHLYLELKHYKKAKELLSQALDIHRKHYKDHSVKIGWISRYLANAHKHLKDFDKAEALLKEVLAINEDHYGPTHTEVALALRDLGHLYFMKGDTERALANLNQALIIFQHVQHPARYRCLEYLGEVYMAKSIGAKNTDKETYKKYKDQATSYFKQALNIAKAHFPKDSAHITRIKSQLFPGGG